MDRILVIDQSLLTTPEPGYIDGKQPRTTISKNKYYQVAWLGLSNICHFIYCLIRIFTLTLCVALSSRSSRSSFARKASALVSERKRDGPHEKAAILSGHFSAIITKIPTLRSATALIKKKKSTKTTATLGETFSTHSKPLSSVLCHVNT